MYIFTYILFLVVPGLCCSLWAFSLPRTGATLCCSVWPSHCCDFSCWGAPALGTQASTVVTHGLVAPQHRGLLNQGDQTCVPSIGRQISIFIHCTIREVRVYLNLYFFFCSWPLPSIWHYHSSPTSLDPWQWKHGSGSYQTSRNSS